MILLAIDPGFEKVGYAVFDKKVNGHVQYTYLTSGLIKTKKTADHEVRLLEIYHELQSIIATYKPELLVMEQLFFFKNQKTVIKVAQAQGTIMLLTAQQKLPLKLLTPLQIKQTITGYGVADKKSVQKMLSLLLKQDIAFEDDDQSDAVACALAYCFMNEKLLSL